MAAPFSFPPKEDARISRYLSGDTSVWDSLKQAISSSSGFQRWQMERNQDSHFQTLSLDNQVHRYLRETLETLAY